MATLPNQRGKNRLHTYTRWPADRDERIELCRVDIGFTNAIAQVLFQAGDRDVPLEVMTIHKQAVQLLKTEEVYKSHKKK